MNYEEAEARKTAMIREKAGKAGFRGKIDAKCKVDDCDSKAEKSGLCNTHYIRLRRYGRTDAARRPKGEGTVKNNGYVQVMINGALNYQHRVVAEGALGRPLKGSEEVHHVDGDRCNNEPSNLVICPDRAYHMLLHKRQKEFSVSRPHE